MNVTQIENQEGEEGDYEMARFLCSALSLLTSCKNLEIRFFEDRIKSDSYEEKTSSDSNGACEFTSMERAT
jgi:hypothetical protein